MISLFLFLFFNTPFYITFGLLIIAMGVGLTGRYFVSGWLFICVIMVFLGGILILFFYVVSLRRQKKNRLQFNFLRLLIVLLLMIFFFTQKIYGGNEIYICSQLYYFSYSTRLYLLTLFLFLCLLAVSKITENFKGAASLRF